MSQLAITTGSPSQSFVPADGNTDEESKSTQDNNPLQGRVHALEAEAIALKGHLRKMDALLTITLPRYALARAEAQLANKEYRNALLTAENGLLASNNALPTQMTELRLTISKIKALFLLGDADQALALIALTLQQEGNHGQEYRAAKFELEGLRNWHFQMLGSVQIALQQKEAPPTIPSDLAPPAKPVTPPAGKASTAASSETASPSSPSLRSDRKRARQADGDIDGTITPSGES